MTRREPQVEPGAKYGGGGDIFDEGDRKGRPYVSSMRWAGPAEGGLNCNPCTT